jgi:DNA ligase-1
MKGVIDGLAIVYGIQPGEGKHKGRMGALLVKELGGDGAMIEEGVTFKIGTGFSDVERERNDWLDTIVRWEAHELTRDGIPRHSRYVADWKGD